MMMGDMMMGGWGMMIGMTLGGLLIVVLLVLVGAAVVKYLFLDKHR